MLEKENTQTVNCNDICIQNRFCDKFVEEVEEKGKGGHRRGELIARREGVEYIKDERAGGKGIESVTNQSFIQWEHLD